MIRVEGFAAAGGPIDIDVRRGEVVLLRGLNGCGKSSLLRLMAGLPSHVAARSVELEGEDPRRIPATEIPAQVSMAFQEARDGLVGLTVAGEFRLRRREFPDDLDSLRDRDVATLSSGEARRVALVLAASGGRLLLLDEPGEGLDAENRRRLRGIVAAGRMRGAVVAVDHAGVLDGLETRAVRLGEAQVQDGHVPALTSPRGAPRLVSQASEANEGVALRFPALRLAAGLHVVIGPNGAGKTTLLRRLAGLDAAEAAAVDDAAVIPGVNVRLLLPNARDHFTHDTVAAEIEDAESWVLAALVPSHLLLRHPLSLSGGEARRVASANVLGRAAPCYLLDEPEAHLDADGRAALYDVLSRRILEGSVVVAATHDDALIAAAHSRIDLRGPG